jgi:hypothetical protein
MWLRMIVVCVGGFATPEERLSLVMVLALGLGLFAQEDVAT